MTKPHTEPKENTSEKFEKSLNKKLLADLQAVGDSFRQTTFPSLAVPLEDMLEPLFQKIREADDDPEVIRKILNRFQKKFLNLIKGLDLDRSTRVEVKTLILNYLNEICSSHNIEPFTDTFVSNKQKLSSLFSTFLEKHKSEAFTTVHKELQLVQDDLLNMLEKANNDQDLIKKILKTYKKEYFKFIDDIKGLSSHSAQKSKERVVEFIDIICTTMKIDPIGYRGALSAEFFNSYKKLAKLVRLKILT
jgi:hypothetical protein